MKAGEIILWMCIIFSLIGSSIAFSEIDTRLKKLEAVAHKHTTSGDTNIILNFRATTVNLIKEPWDK